MEYIATIKKTVRVSENDLERQTVSMRIPADASIADVIKWAEKQKSDCYQQDPIEIKIQPLL